MFKPFKLRDFTVHAGLLLLMLNSSNACAIDLLDAWHAAVQTDPTLAAARAGAEAGQHKTLQAKALKLPQVALTAGAGLTNAYNKITDARFSAPGMGAATGASFTTDTRSGTDLNWNVRLEQPLYNAERFTTARQLNKQAEIEAVKLATEQQQLMLRVSKAYFDVLLAEDQLALIRSQQKVVAEALNTAKARFDEGDLPITDTNEAQARADLLASQALEVESRLQLARALLVDFTGDTGSTLARFPENVDFSLFKAGQLNDWVSLAQTNSPYLQLQQIHQGIAHDEIEKHRAENSPVLNLVAQAGQNKLDGFGGSSDTSLSSHAVSVGMQLTIPIFTGGMRDAKLGEAMALEEQAGHEVDAMRIKAGQMARASWVDLNVGQSRVKALEQALQSSRVRLDATLTGRDVGDRTNLDVLNAEQEYFSAQAEFAKARYQLVLAFLGLYAAIGELNEAHLAEVNIVLNGSR